MTETKRLSIQLKNDREIQKKNEARSIALSKGTSLHDIVIKALSEFCEKNK